MCAHYNRNRDDRLDALLAQGRLSGPRLDRMLAATFPARPQRWLWVGAATVAAIVLLCLPSAKFRARGKAGAILEIGCGTSDGSCPRGATLMFRVSGASDGGFLTAWAERDGERVWYFPTEKTPCPAVERQAELQTLRQGVRLGPEQPSGIWRVHMLLTPEPLGRAEALAHEDHAVRPLVIP